MGWLSDAFKSGFSVLFGDSAVGSLLGVESQQVNVPKPAPEPPAPTPVDPEVLRAKEDRRRRAALGGGTASTIKTSASGLESKASAAKKKTLLGE